ncbi:uncharacterized protein LOC130494236 [Raphanus sativus]|uniref:Uncharacterized protein LOC108849184 n=1 Tax=Raphanus sativus TaxID=3726 RepID=A0A6J0N0I2_RAPSA|nr:uncharacterized protein LOC108849184 [Raphanus sativus]XP_056863286.1 uncharacterized protein LOC130494236 [Raphanus sativus]
MLRKEPLTKFLFYLREFIVFRLSWILSRVQRKLVRKQELPREGNKRSISSNLREWAEAKEIGRRSIILEVKSATNASEQTFIKAQKVNGSQSMRKSQVVRMFHWFISNRTQVQMLNCHLQMVIP